jgi:hypothetical protein
MGTGRGKSMSRLAKVFHLNRQGFNLERAFSGLAIMLLPLIVLSVLHQEKYFLSMVFGILFVELSDPGCEYRYLCRSNTRLHG